jgi:hypothetical protein
MISRSIISSGLTLLFALLACTAAAETKTWTGVTNNLWSVATNWMPEGAPAVGDDLVFPQLAGPPSFGLQNDLPVDTSFRTIHITGASYSISGNRILLTDGITQTVAPSGFNTINLPVTLPGLATFDVRAGVLSVSSAISAPGGVLTKGGAGFLSVTSLAGSARVTAGNLRVAFGVAGAVTVEGGFLTGTAFVHSLNVTGGGVGPGIPGGSQTQFGAGTLNVNGAATFGAGSTYVVDVLGSPPLSDRLDVHGPVSLGGAVLSLNAAGVRPGSVFTIIANDGADAVVGTFHGLPESTLIRAGGAGFVVSYAGGDGNDVTLRAVALHYLTEGATSSFFDTQIALLNPSATANAAATLRFERSDGVAIDHAVAIPALSRRTVDPKTIAGLEVAAFSTLVFADRQLVVDRTMRWDPTSGYGSHAERSGRSTSTTWYLAEGATHSGFNLFYLIHNSQSVPATVTVTYLLPAPAAPLAKTYVIDAHRRFNIWVNEEAAADPALAALASTDVSAVFSSDRPIQVERAMYLDAGGLPFGAGHAGAAVQSPNTRWYLAEGATGAFFDLFVLIANPGGVTANVKATYLLPTGVTVVKQYSVPSRSRFNIWVDAEDPPLADTAVSTMVESDQPVVVERTMWWPGASDTWYEAHNSAGANDRPTRWAVAGGEVGGPAAQETYILIVNTSAVDGAASVMLVFEDDTAPITRTFPLTARSRFTVAVATEFPEAMGKRFGALVEGSPGVLTVVEWGMYSNASGLFWAAGTNALATPLE